MTLSTKKSFIPFVTGRKSSNMNKPYQNYNMLVFSVMVDYIVLEINEHFEEIYSFTEMHYNISQYILIFGIYSR